MTGGLAASPILAHMAGMTRMFLLVAMIGLTCAAPARAAEQAAPFENDLTRLSEVLGALHYLRAICGANEGQKWRVEAQAIMDAEAPSGARRAKLIAGFNRGYRSFQQSYRNCTPAAGLAVQRYLQEGSKISREVTARYAN